MNRKVAIVLTAMALGVFAGGYFWYGSKHARPGVTALIRVTVTPADQLDFVQSKANTPFFKYLMGKKSGVKPSLTQKLQVKVVPSRGVLEATVGVLTKEEGKRYAEAFVETLQDVCGEQVQLSLAGDTVH